MEVCALLRRIISVFLLCVITISLAACDDTSTGGAIYYETPYAPATLDPQLAGSESERMIVTNCFEGLYRQNPDGVVLPALAAETEISADGLTYTFTLHADAVWSEEQPVTADDFVFALTRALLPEMHAPDAELLYTVKGAREVHRNGASADTLGISAPDSDTLIIELTQKDENFLHTLTLPVAMPCNREFFEQCKGRYGLDAKNLLTNGPFYVRRWLETRVTLWQFKGFSGKHPTALSAVVVYFNPDAYSLLGRINASQIDAGKIPAEALAEAQEDGLQTVWFETVCWALILNPDAPDTGSALFREALTGGLDPACYQSQLGGFRRQASSLIPPGLLIHTRPYSEIHMGSSYSSSFALETAKENFLLALDEMEGGSLPPVSLLYPDSEDARLTASLIAQNWQKNLGAYINIQPSDPDTYSSTLRAGGYQLALVPLSSTDGSVRGLLSQLTADGGALLGFTDSTFDTALSAVSSSLSTAGLAEIFFNAEKVLLESKMVVPLFYDLCQIYKLPSCGRFFYCRGRRHPFFVPCLLLHHRLRL